MNNSTRSGFIPYQMGRYDRLDMLLSRGLHSILDRELHYNTKVEIGNICSSISTAMIEVVKKYRKALFPIPVGDHTHIICLPDEFVVGGVVVRREAFDSEGLLTTRSPKELVFRIICAVLLSNDHYISEPLCREISEVVWNITNEFVESNFGPMEPQSPSTQKLLPESMTALVLITNMVLSNASKEEIDRAANYAVSVIAVEKSASDCAEAKRANGVDELVKKYYPT